MRDPLGGFEYELEIRSNFLTPRFQDRGLGHPIERVVNLDRAKTFAVKPEHLLVRKVLRIKRALPLLVRVTAGADVQVHKPLEAPGDDAGTRHVVDDILLPASPLIDDNHRIKTENKAACWRLYKQSTGLRRHWAWTTDAEDS